MGRPTGEIIEQMKEPFPFSVFDVQFTMPSGLFLYLFLATLINLVLWSVIGMVEGVSHIVGWF